MNTLDYGDLLPPFLLGLAGLFFAGVLHRTVVRSSALLRRRHFFESLAVLAFVIAMILMLAGIALWRVNPIFVLVYNAIWMLICVVLAIVVGYRNKQRIDAELTLPELWENAADRAEDPRPREHPRDEPPPRPSDATRARMSVALDAVGRARLKRDRRERSVEHAARADQIRMNRRVYTSREPTVGESGGCGAC